MKFTFSMRLAVVAVVFALTGVSVLAQSTEPSPIFLPPTQAGGGAPTAYDAQYTAQPQYQTLPPAAAPAYQPGYLPASGVPAQPQYAYPLLPPVSAPAASPMPVPVGFARAPAAMPSQAGLVVNDPYSLPPQPSIQYDINGRPIGPAHYATQPMMQRQPFAQQQQQQREGGNGWKVLFFSFIIIAAYLGIGFWYNNKTDGLTGWRAIPHVEFWMSVPGYVGDGCRFTHQWVRASWAKGYPVPFAVATEQGHEYESIGHSRKQSDRVVSAV